MATILKTPGNLKASALRRVDSCEEGTSGLSGLIKGKQNISIESSNEGYIPRAIEKVAIALYEEDELKSIYSIEADDLQSWYMMPKCENCKKFVA